MLKTNLIIALRSLKKHLVYSWINVLGLGIALSCVFLTYLYVSHELNFDKAYPESQTIYRLITEGMNSETMTTNSNLSFVSTEGLKEVFPAIEEITRASFIYSSELVRSKGRYEQAFEESKLVYAEPSFIDIFGLDIISGGYRLLESPNTLIVSERIADKYFYGESAVGGVLLVGGQELEVTGVYKDLPANTSVRPEFVISLQTRKVNPRYEQYFSNPMMLFFQTFVKLNPAADNTTLEEQLTKRVRDKKLLVSGTEKILLEPLKDYHFESLDYRPQFSAQADRRLINWLTGISVGLLLVAIANFGNISLAVAFSRTREVAVYKILGAQRIQLIRRSLLESVLLSTLAFLVALVLMELFQPDFEQFVDRDLSHSSLGIKSYLILFSIATTVGIISGLYPSLLISNIKVMSLFRSGLIWGDKRYPVKKLLMSFQLIITFVMLALTFIMNRQIDYMLTKDPGFEFDDRWVMKSSWNYSRDNARSIMQRFENELMAMPEVEQVTLSEVHPVSLLRKNALRNKKLKDREQEQSILIAGIQCDFFDFYNIRTNFNEEVAGLFCTESKVTVMNRAAIEGFSGDAEGEVLQHFKRGEFIDYVVQQGSVENFHLTSVKENYVPLAFIPLIHANAASFFSIKVGDNTDRERLYKKVSELWWKYEPLEPFSFVSLADEHRRLYSSELKMRSMTSALAIAVCIIAFAGVFALSVFYGRQRLKEVGVRKVLGASFQQLFLLQSKVFVFVFLVSSLVAIPLVQWVANDWTNQFAFRVEPSYWIYVFTGLTLMLCTLLSTGWYSAKVARINPTEIIRDN